MARAVPQLKDVAREASVSLATASIILRNGKGRFHEDTKRRVLESARKLGWRQNLLVQSIQTGKTQTIGVLVPPFDSYWTNVITGIHQELTDCGYMPITLWVSDGQGSFAVEEGGLDQIHKLVDRRVEAMIVWPDFAEAFREYFIDLIQKNVPVLVIDHELSDRKIADSVQTDEEHGSRLAAEHLVGLGHRRIACFGEYQKGSRSWQLKRRRYFEFALQDCPDVKYQAWNLSESDDDGFDVAVKMLDTPDRPTAVFVETDHLAVDVYNAAMTLGIKIPDQLSVLGFANLSFSKSMRPPLTTISQQPVEIGKHAAKLIVDRIGSEGKQILPHTVRVGCEIIQRKSTAVAPDRI